MNCMNKKCGMFLVKRSEDTELASLSTETGVEGCRSRGGVEVGGTQSRG